MNILGLGLFQKSGTRALCASIPSRDAIGKPVRVRRGRKGPKPNQSDEIVLDLIRRKLNGARYVDLASETGFDKKLIRNWCEGINRGHLLDQVLEERYRNSLK